MIQFLLFPLASPSRPEGKVRKGFDLDFFTPARPIERQSHFFFLTSSAPPLFGPPPPLARSTFPNFSSTPTYFVQRDFHIFPPSFRVHLPPPRILYQTPFPFVKDYFKASFAQFGDRDFSFFLLLPSPHALLVVQDTFPPSRGCFPTHHYLRLRPVLFSNFFFPFADIVFHPVQIPFFPSPLRCPF